MHAVKSKAEINVTPLIDVLLVLLIIFMVITPLVPKGIGAFVPQENAQATTPETPVTLCITAQGELLLNGDSVRPQLLQQTVARIYQTRSSKALLLSADRDLEYRNVAHVTDEIRGANPQIEVALVP